MADIRQNATSSFFLPLTGQEQASRLEEKFGYCLDSDDESDPGSTSNQGKVSRWNLDKSSEWLNSQKGTSAFVASGRGKQRLQPKKKRSDQHGRSEPADKQQLHDKSLLPPRTARREKEDARPDKGLETDNRSIEHASRCSTESTSEAEMTEEWNNESPSLALCGMPLKDTERPNLAIVPVSDKVEFRLSTDDIQPPVVVSATINQYLRDYQREGIRFLYQHYTAKTGAILGDDMGLGKTIQVIGFLSALLGKQGNHMDTLHSIPKFIRQMSDDIPSSPPKRACKPFLIVGPSAVMYNWLDELKTWGYFTASKFHGVEKEACIDSLKKGKLEIVVTTFETFRDNITRLNQVEWEAVIVDEVHKIKGLKAQVTLALRAINTPCRFGLTGTALQNNMTELWSLLDWVQPGVLGTLEQFETEFVQVIETGQRHDATKRELAQARKKKNKFSEIRKKMLLRRTKALIADQLPSKEDLVVMCRLSELQISVYRAILTHPDMKLVLCAEDPCDCRSRKNRASCCYKYSANGTKAWALVFSFMHLLLKAANHMALLIPDKNTKEKQAILAKSVCDIAFKDYPQFIEQTQVAAFRTLSDPKYCGKMKVLQGLLNAFYASHDKVLIFSYSTRLLDIIEQYVISQGHEYRRIDGKVSSQHRRDIVIQFNSDKSIFLCLISTKAGGLGLNLTGANRVVIFDPNWNPSHDLQAQDRAYRIGQTRDVKVYRLVSAGTIEENIYLRQIYKQQLDEVAISTANARRYFQGVQGDKGNHGELFGIKNMFSLRTGNCCLTMDILKRNDKLERGLAGYDITHYVPPNQTTTTDFTENDEENTHTDSRSLLDSDAEEEEDEEFLRELFGSERSPIIGAAPQKAGRCSSKAVLTNNYQDSIKSQNIFQRTVANKESDSDDGEFSLIPKLHNSPQHLISYTEKHESPLPQSCDTSSLSYNKDGDAFTVSDISFSSKMSKNSAVLQQKSGTTETRQRGAISGISWLFSDSEGDEENEKQIVGNEGIEIKKCPIDCGSKKSRSSISAKSVSEDSKNSVHAVKGSISHTKNTSAEKRKGVTKSIAAGGIKPGTSKEKVSLEQLVLKSSDVLHMHANAKIIGSSRAEDHMTGCAMKDVFELHTNSQALALQCDPYSQPAKKKLRRGRNKPTEDHNTVKCVSSGSFKILVGQTPASIKRQQWSDFCNFMVVDQLTLAETFLTADVGKRLGLLREFYSQKHPDNAEVLGQVFALQQIGQAPDTDQDKNKAKLSHKSKLTKSAHTDKSLSTDDPAISDYDGRRSPVGPGHHSLKSRSRSNIRKCRPSAVSELLDKSCLSSQSEHSVTAFSPENEDVSLDDKLDNFLPVPPSSCRKSSSSAIALYHRSRTRLRNKRKANPGDGRKNHDKLSSFGEPGSGFTNQYNLDGSLSGIDMSNKYCNTETSTNVAKSKTLMEPDEDITSLLHDMAGRTSVKNMEDCKNRQHLSTHNKICKCYTVCNKKDCALSYTDQGTTARGDPSSRKMASKVGSCTNSNDTKAKQALYSGSKNIACILDDIFSSCLEKPVEKQSSSKKAEFCGEGNHPCKSSNVRVSKSKHSEPSKVSSKVTSDSLVSETDSVFDDLLRTCTLKDERVDSFIRPSRKRNLREKETTAGPGSKGRMEINEKERVSDDIDDLSWCKFDIGSASSKSEVGSESLFS